MSLNISQEHLDYCSDVTMSFVWNAFSERQQTSIMKPLREGVVRDSHCTTVMLTQCIARKLDIPLIKLSKWSLDFPKNDGGPKFEREHPVWGALEKHYQMGKVIIPDESERLEENLEHLHNILDAHPNPVSKTTMNRFPNHFPLHFDNRAMQTNLFTQFKKELVFPVKMESEHRDFLERLERGEISHLKVTLDQNSYNYSRNSELSEDSL